MFSGNGLQTHDIRADLNNHGTCVASKATGAPFGIAKNSNLVSMKIEYDPREALISALRALALVAIDIRDKILMGMAVVNLSYIQLSGGDRNR
jgi:subtilisin family serine protease